MTLTQLKAVSALADERNFARAAEKCFITQPALTIQIRNLEQELGVKIFDRSKKPLVPTEIGAVIIEQARYVLQESEKIADLVREFKKDISGELKLGIIPTVAPYLVPLFINDFLRKYPAVQLNITEKITEEIVAMLKSGDLDAGIFVTPWKDPQIKIMPLFYEEFYVYLSPKHELFDKELLDFSDLTLDNVWLLDEGNCFRNQVINICQAHEAHYKPSLRYQSGSIESLKKIVETRAGLTLIPELALKDLPKKNRRMVRRFKDATPVREVSLVTTRSYLKQRLLEKLKEAILRRIPEQMKQLNNREIVDVEIH